MRTGFECGADAVDLATEASQILRRAMLAYAPRRDVAGLTGSNWLAWLDQGLDEPLFTDGAGRFLESLPYLDPASLSEDEIDLRGMLDAVQLRIKTPLHGAAR